MPVKPTKKTTVETAAVKKSPAAAPVVEKKAPVIKAAAAPKKAKAKSGNGSVAAGDLSSKIAQRAYELWLSRNGSHGDDWSDWLQAEKEIKKN